MYPKMCPNDHEKAQWARMANDCYAKGRKETGDKFLEASKLPEGAIIRLNIFDSLQSEYRSWLIDGFNNKTK